MIISFMFFVQVFSLVTPLDKYINWMHAQSNGIYQISIMHVKGLLYNVYSLFSACEAGEWSEWSECSGCDESFQTRTRSITYTHGFPRDQCVMASSETRRCPGDYITPLCASCHVDDVIVYLYYITMFSDRLSIPC